MVLSRIQLVDFGKIQLIELLECPDVVHSNFLSIFGQILGYAIGWPAVAEIQNERFSSFDCCCFNRISSTNKTAADQSCY